MKIGKLLIVFFLILMFSMTYCSKIMPHEITGTYSAGNEPDEENMYMVIKDGKFTLYDQKKILNQGKLKETSIDDDLAIYYLFSENNEKIGYCIHKKRFHSSAWV